MDSYFFQSSLNFKRKLYFTLSELCIGPTFYLIRNPAHFSIDFFKFYFWLCCIFVAAHGLSLAAASKGFSLQWLLLLQTMAAVAVVQELNYPNACGIFPDRVSNLCSLYWQMGA